MRRVNAYPLGAVTDSDHAYYKMTMQLIRPNGITIATIIVIMSVALILPGLAQNTVTVPGVLAPVPMPPAPMANVPQPPGSPPKLDTYSDRVSRCVHFGAVQGLPPGSRDAYTRACANN
jgi:hypothetical protein